MIEEFYDLYRKVYKEEPGSADPIFHGSQIQAEFIRAWNILIETIDNSEGVFTFLEIGAYRGVWPLMLSYVCEKLGKQFEYTTVTWLDQDPNNSAIYNVVTHYREQGLVFNLINKNSQEDSTRDSLQDKYDVVFIDADHRYEGIIKDINLYSNLATKVLMFHDIRTKQVNNSCGVYQAIQDAGITLDTEIVTNENIMGIGLKFI